MSCSAVLLINSNRILKVVTQPMVSKRTYPTSFIILAISLLIFTIPPLYQPSVAVEEIPDTAIGVVSVRIWIEQDSGSVDILESTEDGFPSIINGSSVRIEASLRNYSPDSIRITNFEANIYSNETHVAQSFSKEYEGNIDRASCPSNHIITEYTDTSPINVQEYMTYRMHIFFVFDRLGTEASGEIAAYHRNISIQINSPPPLPPDIIFLLLGGTILVITGTLVIGLYGRIVKGRPDES